MIDKVGIIPQTCCTLTSNSLLFPTRYLDFRSSLLLKKWYLPICPSFQGVSWRRRTLPQSKTRSVPISSQHSKCVLHPLTYHQIWYLPSYLFLYFRQQTGQTLAEKALEDDRFDAKKWLNFHDVQVTAYSYILENMTINQVFNANTFPVFLHVFWGFYFRITQSVCLRRRP